MPKSYSQNGQDLFVRKLFRNKKDGYFLEIGGGDGIWISNTLLLEQELSWTGILVEPTNAFSRLVKNRPNCICVNQCVADEFKSVSLVEIHDRGQAMINPDAASENTLLTRVSEHEVPTLSDFDSKWGRAEVAYEIDAAPLEHILDEANAPQYIDYFSLDVEGYEDQVLMSFPFHRYSFGCLGVENPSERLMQRLSERGYVAVKQLGGDTMYLNSSIFKVP